MSKTCIHCKKSFSEKRFINHLNRKQPCKKIVDNILGDLTTFINSNENQSNNKNESKSKYNKIILGDCINVMKTLESGIAQIIICDPPYNIGKNFGNNFDSMTMDDYIVWCKEWIQECLRILKDNGTMFIYGFSEILAYLMVHLPTDVNKRWLVWHYTNKNVPSLKFWQRSHESILAIWKKDKVFNTDLIREPYSEQFIKNSAGKIRPNTKGRFSNGTEETLYQAHQMGAMPRDVIKIPALAGGSGYKERVDHPTQKPLALCEKLINSCKQDDGILLVPFAGSGSECVSSKKLGIPFIGIEINQSYIDIINERLN
jgi:site-specific DNA-methyltransferase (adenine-specific)